MVLALFYVNQNSIKLTITNTQQHDKNQHCKGGFYEAFS